MVRHALACAQRSSSRPARANSARGILTLALVALSACSPQSTGRDHTATAGATGNTETLTRHTTQPGTATRPATLASVTSWAYQLHSYPNNDLAEIAASKFQMAVVDSSSDGTAAREWTPAQITHAKSNKLLLAYLSIGEAEDYRHYWRGTWKTSPPPWLGAENPNWPGNYRVQYWHPSWQALITHSLNRVIAQGFDGAYLDLVDAYQHYPNRRTARQDMINWVCAITRHARARNPNFHIVTQNASELIWTPGYAECIDATGQEETFYRATDVKTSSEERRARLRDYAEYRRHGKPVFTVDYANKKENITETYRTARAHGLIPYVTDVDLGELRVDSQHDPR